MIVKPGELMVYAAACEIKNTDVVFVGMRLPLLAFFLAKAAHAPECVGFFENGLIRDEPAHGPVITMCDPPNIKGAVACTSLRDAMSYLQQGRVSLGFIGGAQIDKYGNLNTTRVGSTRLTGSGGAGDIASMAGRTITIMYHEKRRFVEKVDYITSPGFGDGAGWREKQGLIGGGPSAIVTSYGIMRFDPLTKRAVLAQVHPGVNPEKVCEETGWKLTISPDLKETPTPGLAELALIRKFDPRGFWTGRE